VQVKIDQLEAQLARKVPPVVADHGDEPLLALEAADAVRAAARKAGHAERTVLEPGRSFDWSEFTHAAASLSLFAEKKLVELRLSSGKPAAPAVAALVGYCAQPSPDVVLLVTMPRPEGSGWWKSDWFLALDSAGLIVGVEPVTRAQLPRWLGARLARQGQKAPQDVLEFLAARVEGNLLAAHQEVQKLALLAPQGELALETVQQAVASVARYDPYAAAEALVAGDTGRYVRVIEGLRGEGEQPTLVLFVLASTLFVLQGLASGTAAESLFMQHRLFNKPLQRAVQAAAQRYRAGALDAALAQAAAIDRSIKGVGSGDAWERFIALGLNLAGGSKA
jgi:DNA polymerase-3 subunit delta